MGNGQGTGRAAAGSSAPLPAGRRLPAKFVDGSIMRHLLVMTGTSAIGLMAIFIGDLANIFFLSLLNDVESVAAVGDASSILFFATSIGIGLAIAATALVSPAIGARDLPRARRLATNTHLAAVIVSAALALVLWLLVPLLLSAMGATGRTHRLAGDYLMILVPALPPLASGMTSGAVLRSAGDAPRAMYVTLSGAIVNIILDPILIFALGLGIHGAAIALVVARFAIMAIGLRGVVQAHDLLAAPDLPAFAADTRASRRLRCRRSRPISPIRSATPMSRSPSLPTATRRWRAWPMIGRVMPVAFGAITRFRDRSGRSSDKISARSSSTVSAAA